MIQPHQLKINNWVYYLGTPTKIFTGAQIDKNFERIEPIPLTPEILTGCGLGTMPGEVRWYAKSGAHFWGYIDEGEFIQETELPFVHQLQNLFFALTATELEITSMMLPNKQTA